VLDRDVGASEPICHTPDRSAPGVDDESIGRMTPEPDELAASGVPGLDDLTSGGFPRGRLYLVQGEPGSGKTTLAMQFLLEGVARDETVLYIALSETRSEIEAVARSHGWDLSRVHLHELSAADQWSHADDQNTLFDPAEVDLQETTSQLLEVVERLNPARVVFDSLSELRLLAQHPLRYRRQILALKDYFSGRGCTVMLIDDANIDRNDLQLRTLAHGVLSLEHLAPEYGGDRRRLRVVKLRGVPFRGGFHDFVIERGGIVVFPSLIAAEHQATPVREAMSSGNPELDRLVGGGFDRGTSTLLLGPAGSGKSAITSQCVAAAAERGEQPSVFLFEENRDTYFARARALGQPLDRYLSDGEVYIRQVDPAELSPGQFSSLVRQRVERHGSRVVVVDSLNGYLAAMPEERFLVIQLHEVLTYLAHKGVATFLVVAQHGLTGSAMQSPVDVTYLADTVVLTRYFEAGGAVRRALSVVKKRSGDHERTIRELSMGPEGIVVGAPLVAFHGVLTGVPRFVGNTEALTHDD
jgi:circadian clock protein KaiC